MSKEVQSYKYNYVYQLLESDESELFDKLFHKYADLLGHCYWQCCSADGDIQNYILFIDVMIQSVEEMEDKNEEIKNFLSLLNKIESVCVDLGIDRVFLGD